MSQLSAPDSERPAGVSTAVQILADAFADFGVREGYRKLHTLETQPKPKELAAIGEMWSPWRSVASWYLWRAADEGRTIKQPQPAA
mgnify:CR=1 FL=1